MFTLAHRKFIKIQYVTILKSLMNWLTTIAVKCDVGIIDLNVVHNCSLVTKMTHIIVRFMSNTSYIEYVTQNPVDLNIGVIAVILH